MTPDQLHKIMPRADANLWAPLLTDAAQEFGIITKEHLAFWLAMIAVESSELTVMEEGLNYSAERLMAVWPKRFPTIEKAQQYAHNPEKLANYVYANRMGNGDEESGDGWNFRGSGPGQITGRDNHKAFLAHVETDCAELLLPDSAIILLSPRVGASSAAWFWKYRKCAEAAKHGIEAVTKAWNGGTIGLAQRKRYFNLAMSVL